MVGNTAAMGGVPQKVFPQLHQALLLLGFRPLYQEDGLSVWLLDAETTGLARGTPPLKVKLGITGTNHDALYIVTAQYVRRMLHAPRPIRTAEPLCLSAVIACEAVYSRVVRREIEIMRGELTLAQHSAGDWRVPWYLPAPVTIWGDPPTPRAALERIEGLIAPAGTHRTDEIQAQHMERATPAARTYRALRKDASRLDIPGRTNMSRDELADAVNRAFRAQSDEPDPVPPALLEAEADLAAELEHDELEAELLEADDFGELEAELEHDDLGEL